MKRRSFFKNLIGSMAILVEVYAKPFHRVEFEIRKYPPGDYRLVREMLNREAVILGRLLRIKIDEHFRLTKVIP